jgi:hypothetical protein
MQLWDEQKFAADEVLPDDRLQSAPPAHAAINPTPARTATVPAIPPKRHSARRLPDQSRRDCRVRNTAVMSVPGNHDASESADRKRSFTGCVDLGKEHSISP